MSGNKPKSRNRLIPIKCKCGCGQTTIPDKWGRYNCWIKEHKIRKKKSREDWITIYNDFLKTLPLCECGCGEKVNPVCSNIDYFIKMCGHRKHYRFARGHMHHPKNHDHILTSREKSLIIGTLLGDSCLLYPGKSSLNPRLKFNHSIKQKEWVRYKVEKLEFLNMKISVSKNGGYGDFICTGISSCLPSLKKIHNITHINNKKTITKEMLDLLDNEGIAWWFCDDGSRSRKRYISRLHIEGYTYPEQELIRDYIHDKFGYCDLRKYKQKYYYLNIPRITTKKLFKAIKEYIPPSMQYKIEDIA